MEDLDTVESKFVFAADFEVHSVSSRVWEVPEYEMLCALFKSYSDLYF